MRILSIINKTMIHMIENKNQTQITIGLMLNKKPHLEAKS